MTYIRVEVSKSRGGPRKGLRLLVDTGAFASMVPSEILQRLQVEPEERRELRVANGKSMFRWMGRMYVHYEGRTVETFVIFGKPGDARLLGSYALEGLELEVDPKGKRVRHVKVFPMYGATPA